MKHSYGELIGNSIGKVLDLDVDTDDTGWGSFLHVKTQFLVTNWKKTPYIGSSSNSIDLYHEHLHSSKETLSRD